MSIMPTKDQKVANAESQAEFYKKLSESIRSENKALRGLVRDALRPDGITFVRHHGLCALGGKECKCGLENWITRAKALVGEE